MPWVAALSEITNCYEGDAPRYQTGAWRRAFSALGFQFTDERHVRHAHIGTVEDIVLKRTLSVSFIAARPAEQRQEVRALIARTPELSKRGEIAFPYETSMYAYARTEQR